MEPEPEAGYALLRFGVGVRFRFAVLGRGVEPSSSIAACCSASLCSVVFQRSCAPDPPTPAKSPAELLPRLELRRRRDVRRSERRAAR